MQNDCRVYKRTVRFGLFGLADEVKRKGNFCTGYMGKNPVPNENIGISGVLFPFPWTTVLSPALLHLVLDLIDELSFTYKTWQWRLGGF